MFHRFLITIAFVFCASLLADENRIGPTGIPEADLKKMKAGQLLDIAETSLKEDNLFRASAVLSVVIEKNRSKSEDSQFADFSYRLAAAYEKKEAQRAMLMGNNQVGLSGEKLDQDIDAFLLRREEEKKEKAALTARIQAAETKAAGLEKELAALDDAIATMKQEHLREVGEKNTVINKLTASETALKTANAGLKTDVDGARSAYGVLLEKHTTLQKRVKLVLAEDQQATQQTGITHFITKVKIDNGIQPPSNNTANVGATPAKAQDAPVTQAVVGKAEEKKE